MRSGPPALARSARRAAAAVLLVAACAHGVAHAESPFVAYERGDYPTAARGYLEAAEGGDRLAAFNLAMMVFRGETPGPREVAVAWLRRSAEQA